MIDNPKISFVGIKSSFAEYPSRAGATILITVAGCSLGCSECQNKELQQHSSGTPLTVQQLIEKVDKFNNSRVKHNSVTFIGGDPMFEKNIEAIKVFCKNYVGKICIYTGYSAKYIQTVWENIPDNVMFKCGAYNKDRKPEEIDIGKLVHGEHRWFQLASTNQNFFSVLGGKLEKISDNGKMKLL